MVDKQALPKLDGTVQVIASLQGMLVLIALLVSAQQSFVADAILLTPGTSRVIFSTGLLAAVLVLRRRGICARLRTRGPVFCFVAIACSVPLAVISIAAPACSVAPVLLLAWFLEGASVGFFVFVGVARWVVLIGAVHKSRALIILALVVLEAACCLMVWLFLGEWCAKAVVLLSEVLVCALGQVAKGRVRLSEESMRETQESRPRNEAMSFGLRAQAFSTCVVVGAFPAFFVVFSVGYGLYLCFGCFVGACLLVTMGLIEDALRLVNLNERVAIFLLELCLLWCVVTRGSYLPGVIALASASMIFYIGLFLWVSGWKAVAYGLGPMTAAYGILRPLTTGLVLGGFLCVAIGLLFGTDLRALIAASLAMLVALAISQPLDFYMQHRFKGMDIALAEAAVDKPPAVAFRVSTSYVETYNRASASLAAAGGLTEREAEIAALLARGRNAEFIGDRLYISTSTVRTHVSHIYQKLEVANQQEYIDAVESILKGENGSVAFASGSAAQKGVD